MKYRLGMLVAAMTLMVSVAFAQEINPRVADGVTQVRNAWLMADQAACNAWNAWANPFALWDKANPGDFRANQYGLGVGLDRNFGSNLKIGLYTEYSHTDNEGIASYDWDIGAYAMYRFGKFFIDAKTSYLYDHINPKGWDNGNGWHGAFNVGYQFVFGCDFSVTPTVGLDYGYQKYNSAWKWHSLELPLLVTVSKRFATSFGSISPFVRGGWRHEFHKGMSLNGKDKQVDYGTVGLGVAANINSRADMFAAWDYKWASRYYQNKLNLGMGINF